MSGVQVQPPERTEVLDRQLAETLGATPTRVVKQPVPNGQSAHARKVFATREAQRVALLALLTTAGAMFLIAAVVLVFSALSRPSHLALGSPQSAGSVAAVNVTTGQLVLRSAQGNLRSVNLPRSGGVISRDGHILAPTSVQIGDTVIVRPAVVQDTSQVWTVLRGLVAVAPDLGGDSMILQTGKSQQIVVSIGHATRVNGSSPNDSSLMSIRDSAQVHVSGILNIRLGEMTQTETINEVYQAG